MRLILACMAVVAMLASQPAAAQVQGTLERIRETGVIRLGFRPSEPPMSFVDQNGRPAGYSVDICMQIVAGVAQALKRNDLTVEFIGVDSATRFSSLADDQIDILCGSTTKTLSRRQIVDFTQLTFVTGGALMSMNDTRVGGVQDLKAKRVGVVHGTTTIGSLNAVLEKTGVAAEVITFDLAKQGLDALRAGEIDAFASDQVVLIGLALTSGDGSNFYITEQMFSFEPFALAVRRNDADFRLLADTVLSSLYRSGNIREIYGRWFGGLPFDMPQLLQALYQLNATPE